MLQNLIKTESTFCRLTDDSLKHKSVQRLTELAGKKVNSIALPLPWEWETHDVIDWLENDVQLPEYKECIERNYINGRRLLLLRIEELMRIGIHDYSHIKTLMESIRQLFNVKNTKFGRSICLPPEYPMRLFLEYRAPTGPIRESVPATEFFGKIGILDNWRNCLHNRNSKSRVAKTPCIRFGLIKRKSVYTKIELKQQNYMKKKKFIDFLGF